MPEADMHNIQTNLELLKDLKIDNIDFQLIIFLSMFG